MTKSFTDPDALADAIIAEVGRDIVLGLPLGLGKANHIANALFARALKDPSISLRIFTALTLETPPAKTELERRFIGPVMQRLVGGYPPLTYAAAVHRQNLPSNIEVNEFFFLAGRWLTNATAQRRYISANYTHAASYFLNQGINVVAQLVAKRGDRYSLSSNTDITLDILSARDAGEAKFLLVGETNSELPFMPGDGDLPASMFSHVLDSQATDFQLFAPPKTPISTTDYAIGLNVARLIADGGTLQIGIGEEGDAAVAAMILRHRHNAEFRKVVAALTRGAPPLAIEEHGTFEEGLYGVSEMLVDGFLELIDAGILKREVDGVILHGGFFLGPHSFYRRLREMAPEALARIQMTRISFTNQLYGDEAGKKAARVKARFVNNAMMATALGAVISDALEDGRVVSGVGGQFNFVDQAFALPGAHSILALHATRNSKSNILWSYGHTTIPRHLRDFIVTEYGIADLRGQPDEEVVHRMIAITDSRFQDELVRLAKEVGKLAKSYEVPAASRENHPGRIASALKPLRDNGMLPDFPFGSDFTDVELRLLPALERLQGAKPMDLLRLGLAGLGKDVDVEALGRMGYVKPASLGDRFWRALLNGALKA